MKTVDDILMDARRDIDKANELLRQRAASRVPADNMGVSDTATVELVPAKKEKP